MQTNFLAWYKSTYRFAPCESSGLIPDLIGLVYTYWQPTVFEILQSACELKLDADWENLDQLTPYAGEIYSIWDNPQSLRPFFKRKFLRGIAIHVSKIQDTADYYDWSMRSFDNSGRVGLYGPKQFLFMALRDRHVAHLERQIGLQPYEFVKKVVHREMKVVRHILSGCKQELIDSYENGTPNYMIDCVECQFVSDDHRGLFEQIIQYTVGPCDHHWQRVESYTSNVDGRAMIMFGTYIWLDSMSRRDFNELLSEL